MAAKQHLVQAKVVLHEACCIIWTLVEHSLLIDVIVPSCALIVYSLVPVYRLNSKSTAGAHFIKYASGLNLLVNQIKI